jgi:hypothetical protein
MITKIIGHVKKNGRAQSASGKGLKLKSTAKEHRKA